MLTVTEITMISRNEYPRPNFRRKEWFTLNGEWEFEFDDGNDGIARNLPSGNVKLKKKINVPFAYQCKASGIGDESVHETVWYKRNFRVDKQSGSGVLLCFNGSDYKTDVWVNGSYVLSHIGAYTPFKADVAKFVHNGDNTVVVRCSDPQDNTNPRGKQSWTGEKFACWYEAATGIWQSVWIEYFGSDCIDEYSLTTDIDACEIYGDLRTLYGKADEIEITVSLNGHTVNRGRFSARKGVTKYSLSVKDPNALDKVLLWWPHKPTLYDIEYRLFASGKEQDFAKSRFGMRKVSVDGNGMFCINDCPFYQRLILDQGYWKDSGITPPSADALKDDIMLAKSMGFNGARKHQKTEDPYFNYYADEIGFITWCEMPSAYDFCDKEIKAVAGEWAEIVSVHKNHTSVVAYVPLNESWGVKEILTDKKQQDFAASLYYLTKALDGTRPVSVNDGWENTDETDLVTVHDYAPDSSNFDKLYVNGNIDEIYPVGKKLMINGAKYRSQPIIFSEFGGISMAEETEDGAWVYNSGANNSEELYSRLENLLRGIRKCNFQGFCYTQLTDVRQEMNGLLSEGHKPKFDNGRLKKIFEI